MTKEKRGIVMELSGRKAIILTPEGKFLRIRLSKPAKIGEEVSSNPRSVFHWRSVSVRSAVAGLAAIVVFGLGIGQLLMGVGLKVQAYAFVSVDANPSVSFELDKNLHVIGVHALNSKGNQLVRALDALHVKGKPIDTAIHEMMNQELSKGNLPSGNAIIVTASSPSGNADINSLESQITSDVHDALKNVKQSGSSPQVYSINVPASVWKDAMKKKVSPSKYATYLLAKEAGIHVKLTDIQSSNMQLVLAQAHDLQTGVKHLESGHVKTVTSIVQQALQTANVKAANQKTAVNHKKAVKRENDQNRAKDQYHMKDQNHADKQNAGHASSSDHAHSSNNN